MRNEASLATYHGCDRTGLGARQTSALGEVALNPRGPSWGLPYTVGSGEPAYESPPEPRRLRQPLRPSDGTKIAAASTVAPEVWRKR